MDDRLILRIKKGNPRIDIFSVRVFLCLSMLLKDNVKMKYRLLAVFFVFIMFTLPAGGSGDTAPLSDDYLWLEYGDAERQKDGSLILEIKIRYGRFPDKITDLAGIENIRAFYHADDEQGKRVPYKSEIHKSRSGYSVIIRSAKTNQYTMRVTARRKNSEQFIYYQAKASFTLFGKSMSQDEGSDIPSDGSIDSLFEINKDPEHYYWPQTGNPLKLSVMFKNEKLGKQIISVFDENLGHEVLKAGEEKDCTYIPPDDRKLNSMGETAYKQTVLVSNYSEDNDVYISSYTLLLHRSRFGKHEHTPGLILFGSTFAVFLILMIIKRMRARI